MESLLNYLVGESENKMIHLLPWQQQINFNGLIMPLEQIFLKIVTICCFSLSKTNVQQSYLKIYQRLTDL